MSLMSYPIDGSPPGSPIPGILQARTLEWVPISFSSAGQWKVKEVAQSCPTLSDPMDCSLPGSSVHGIFQARVLEWGAIAFSDIQCYTYTNIRERNLPFHSIISTLKLVLIGKELWYNSKKHLYPNVHCITVYCSPGHGSNLDVNQ